MFELGEIHQRVEAVQSPEATLAIATGLRFSEQLVMVLDPYCTIAQGSSHAQAAGAISRPDTGGKTELSVIGTCYRLRFVLEGLQHKQRPEDFLLAEESAAVAVLDQTRR